MRTPRQRMGQDTPNGSTHRRVILCPRSQGREPGSRRSPLTQYRGPPTPRAGPPYSHAPTRQPSHPTTPHQGTPTTRSPHTTKGHPMQLQPAPKQNPRRINGHTRDKVRALVIRQETHCWLCKQPVDKTIRFTPGQHNNSCTKHNCTGCKLDPRSPEADEIIPVSKGGSHTDRNNIRLSHRICNQRRGNKDITEMNVKRMQPLKTSRQWR